MESCDLEVPSQSKDRTSTRCETVIVARKWTKLFSDGVPFDKARPGSIVLGRLYLQSHADSADCARRHTYRCAGPGGCPTLGRSGNDIPG